jgi:hypothetical protein
MHAVQQKVRCACTAGLPDGILSYQKSQFGYFLEGLRLEKVGIFFFNLDYITGIWYIL